MGKHKADLHNFRKEFEKYPKLFSKSEDRSAPRSKAWICSRSLAGISGSNPAGGMDVCIF
jgi:hypothetical protein